MCYRTCHGDGWTKETRFFRVPVDQIRRGALGKRVGALEPPASAELHSLQFHSQLCLSLCVLCCVGHQQASRSDTCASFILFSVGSRGQQGLVCLDCITTPGSHWTTWCALCRRAVLCICPLKVAMNDTMAMPRQQPDRMRESESSCREKRKRADDDVSRVSWRLGIWSVLFVSCLPLSLHRLA